MDINIVKIFCLSILMFLEIGGVNRIEGQIIILFMLVHSLLIPLAHKRFSFMFVN